MKDWTALDRFLHPDPHDVGCEKALELPHVYGDLVAADVAGAERYPAVLHPCRRGGR